MNFKILFDRMMKHIYRNRHRYIFYSIIPLFFISIDLFMVYNFMPLWVIKFFIVVFFIWMPIYIIFWGEEIFMKTKDKKINDEVLFNIENDVSRQANDEKIPETKFIKNKVISDKIEKAKLRMQELKKLEKKVSDTYSLYMTLSKEYDKKKERMVED